MVPKPYFTWKVLYIYANSKKKDFVMLFLFTSVTMWNYFWVMDASLAKSTGSLVFIKHVKHFHASLFKCGFVGNLYHRIGQQLGVLDKATLVFDSTTLFIGASRLVNFMPISLGTFANNCIMMPCVLWKLGKSTMLL